MSLLDSGPGKPSLFALANVALYASYSGGELQFCRSYLWTQVFLLARSACPAVTLHRLRSFDFCLHELLNRRKISLHD
jgi:hypothetical protein